MKNGYRAMVTVTAALTVLCTACVTFAGIRLLQYPMTDFSKVSRTVAWETDGYRIRGRIADGMLEELHIVRRISAE